MLRQFTLQTNEVKAIFEFHIQYKRIQAQLNDANCHLFNLYILIQGINYANERC
jgi:hypothetical protein